MKNIGEMKEMELREFVRSMEYAMKGEFVDYVLDSFTTAPKEKLIAELKVLVSYGLNIDLPNYLAGKVDIKTYSLLTYAVRKSNVQLCEVLLKSGSNPNQGPTGNDHITPLCALELDGGKALEACSILELLVGFGADLHARHWQTRFFDTTYYKYLLEGTERRRHWPDVDVFIETLKKMRYQGPILLVREMIKKNADLSVPVKNDLPFLHYCADNLWYDCVEELTNAGADINYRTSKHGNNCLHILASKKNPSLDTIQFLIDRGVDLSKKNLKGKTPKMIAEAHGNGLLFP